MGCLSIDCLAWLSFLCYQCLRFVRSSSKSARFASIRWSSSDVDDVHAPPSGASSAGAETGFGSGRISFGDLVVAEVTSYEKVWSLSDGGDSNKGVTFYKPVNLPQGFHCLGYVCRPNQGSAEGAVLVASEDNFASTPVLAKPVGYKVIWSSTEPHKSNANGCFFWQPSPPDGYSCLGYVVTTTPDEPSTEHVMCVRTDLTDACQVSTLIWETKTPTNCKVWSLMPAEIGAEAKGVPVGAFFCGDAIPSTNSNATISCLKNPWLSGMPTLTQLQVVIQEYGPTFYFHPDEKYFPSSVSWFFSKGALLYTRGEGTPVLIAAHGSNLPAGDVDDDKYWIDLPDDATADEVKLGNLSTATVYVHAKPMLGAAFTDIAMWLYYPFNGAATAKVELVDIKLGKIGEHVSDWEHVTLRVNNLTGKLAKVYYSQHSGGEWIDAANVEYGEGSNCVVYSSKSGHASYAHPGLVLQGDHGVGIRNDSAKSKFTLDSSQNFTIISAQYLQSQDSPQEPAWLQYMRKWGPKVQYNFKNEVEKVIHKAPSFLRSMLRSLTNKLPEELFQEEGPTGPKEKSSWMGDERG